MKTYTSSGMKQDHKGNLYLDLRGSDGTVERLDLEHLPLPSMQNVVLARSALHSHRWNFNSLTKAFQASVCGVFGCCCCDQANLPARLSRLTTTE